MRGAEFRFLQVSAFKAWFGNEIIRYPRGAIPLGDYWLTHQRAGANKPGIEFYADRLTDARRLLQEYILWQGFAVGAAAGRLLEIPGAPEGRIEFARGNQEHSLPGSSDGRPRIVQEAFSRKMERRWLFRGSLLGTGKIQSRKGVRIRSLEIIFQKVASARYITGQIQFSYVGGARAAFRRGFLGRK